MSFAASLSGSLIPPKSPDPARPAYQNTAADICEGGQMIIDIAPTNGAENDHETSASNTKSDPTSVIRLGWADITRNLGIM